MTIQETGQDASIVSLPSISAKGADRAMAAALDYAESRGWQVCIAVVDAVGNLLAFKRMDNTSTLSVFAAQEKARTAAVLRRDSGAFAELIDAGKPSFLGLKAISALPGGVAAFQNGIIVGAVGVSGVQGHEDIEIAQAAVAAVIKSA